MSPRLCVALLVLASAALPPARAGETTRLRFAVRFPSSLSYAGGDYGDRAEHCWNGDHTRPNACSRLRHVQVFASSSDATNG